MTSSFLSPRSTAQLLCFLLLCLLFPAALPAQRNLQNIPDPDPELERATFVLEEGFEVNLFAGDPQIAKPIHMNFDAQGRLWIAGSETYPHIVPGAEANDKILVVEDTNGDGTADRTTVFAEGLLIPTGVLPGDGGVYVANSTELIHLSDTDGDGRADRRRVVLSGFGTEDTHHLLHTLRWGVDGLLYMNQSIYIHSHVETPYGVRRLGGGGIWHFHPPTQRLEVFCRGFVNPWGHIQDRFGQSFATDGAYGEGINYVFPGAVFVTAPGASRRVEGLNPGSPKHCGLEIVGGRHLPEDWEGNLLTCDFRAHRVCRFRLTEEGSGYVSRQMTELMKSTHVAFRPIDVKMGPDGAIYIADWYNPIIQHGEVDFRDPRRDRVHGRIWRVTAKDRPLVERPRIVGSPPAELAALLASPETTTRQFARLELRNHAPEEAAAAVIAWEESLPAELPDREQLRLEAAWALQTLHRFPEDRLAALLASPDGRVRAAALRIGYHSKLTSEDSARFLFERARAGAVDEHPRVRLEAVRLLSLFGTPEGAAAAARALDQPLDRFLDFALWQTLRDLSPAWLPALKQGELTFRETEHLAFALAAIDSPEVVAPLLSLVRGTELPAEQLGPIAGLVAALATPEQLGLALEVTGAPHFDSARRHAWLSGLLEGSTARKLRPPGELPLLADLLRGDDQRLAALAARAAGAWGVQPLRDALNRLAGGEAQAGPELRAAAVEGLAGLGGEPSVAALLALSQEEHPWVVRRGAVAGLSRIAPRAAARRLAALLAEGGEEVDPAELLAPLMTRQGGPAALAAALEEQTLPADVARLTLRAARSSPQHTPALLEAIQRAGKLGEAGWKATPELLADLAGSVGEGDPSRGEAIYRRAELQCMKCHAIGGAGGIVGPEFSSLGASAQPDYLIESLLDPNAKVKEGYHSVTIATTEGRVVTGIPARETGAAVVLRDAEGKEVSIPKETIDERLEGPSLMPAGLLDSLTRQELLDLLRFLSELGKVGDFAVPPERLSRRWEVLQYTPEGHRRLNRTSFDTAATEDPELTWQVAYSRVAGDLPLAGLPTLQPHRQLAPTTFVRCVVEVTTPGPVGLRLGETSGLSLWINERPTPVEAEMVTQLEAGAHRLTLAVNREERAAGVRLELFDPAGSRAQARWVLEEGE